MTIASCLDLFGCVPYYTLKFYHEVVPEQGVLVHSGAVYALEEIKQWLKAQKVPYNKAFYDSWHKCKNVSLTERYSDQITHYFSTYGLQSMGLDSPDLIYLPNSESIGLPPKTGIKVIKGVDSDEIKERCLKLLSGVALTQETITKVLEVLELVKFNFEGYSCRNREAVIMIADRYGLLPRKADDLFRYFVYKATGETLVIKNPKLIQLIKESGYVLPELTEAQLVNLAGSFNRYKPLWLAFKRKNASVVNRISKLSKKHHKPMPVNVLGSLTHELFSPKVIAEAAQEATTSALVRAYNACLLYQDEATERLYRIRNGKAHARRKEAKNKEWIKLHTRCLLPLIEERIKQTPIFCPAHISYAVPTSEKNFVGNVPSGTKITIPKTNEHLLVGVYWEGYNTDIDLSALGLTKIGWNSRWSSNGKGLLYSGDITSAPYGATEWLYAMEIDDSYLVKVQLFRGPADTKFKLILGYGGKADKEYMIHPNKVMFEAQLQFVEGQREMTFGLLTQEDESFAFYLSNLSTGCKTVSSMGDKEVIQRKALAAQAVNTLRIDELLPSVIDLEEEYVDLSPNKLNKDTLLALI